MRRLNVDHEPQVHNIIHIKSLQDKRCHTGRKKERNKIMIADKMRPLVENNSAIRAMFEEGKKMSSVYGRENVYDFSLEIPMCRLPRR